ncbi:MAG: hypothetical protein D3903_19860 [Candidatus Electrothrix sp. GM3_4]|nr:hypothetical protein [Candidatus Electrothrix sp. GM3_4]
MGKDLDSILKIDKAWPLNKNRSAPLNIIADLIEQFKPREAQFSTNRNLQRKLDAQEFFPPSLQG